VKRPVTVEPAGTTTNGYYGSGVKRQNIQTRFWRHVSLTVSHVFTYPRGLWRTLCCWIPVRLSGDLWNATTTAHSSVAYLEAAKAIAVSIVGSRLFMARRSGTLINFSGCKTPWHALPSELCGQPVYVISYRNTLVAYKTAFDSSWQQSLSRLSTLVCRLTSMMNLHDYQPTRMHCLPLHICFDDHYSTHFCCFSCLHRRCYCVELTVCKHWISWQLCQ